MGAAPMPGMYSKARIAGHAVHPMLVGFPIALFAATVGLELAYIGTRDVFYYRAAMVANTAGVCGALVAMLPGAIDLFALPKGSRTRAVGIQHALHAMVTTALFALSGALLYRGWVSREMVDGAYVLDATLPLAVDVVAFVLLVATAMIGHSLVQTHHLGIKPAAIRAHLPSRDPELDAVLANLEATPAVRTLVARRIVRPAQRITAH